MSAGLVVLSVSGCISLLSLLGYSGAARMSRLCLVLVISNLSLSLIVETVVSAVSEVSAGSQLINESLFTEIDCEDNPF